MVLKGFQSKISWVSHGFQRPFNADFFLEVFVSVWCPTILQGIAQRNELNNKKMVTTKKRIRINVKPTQNKAMFSTSFDANCSSMLIKSNVAYHIHINKMMDNG